MSSRQRPAHAVSLDLRSLAEGAELLTEAIVNTVRESLLILDGTLHIRLANRSFYINFGALPEDTLDRLIYQIGNGQWNIPGLRQLLEEILPKNGSFRDFEVIHKFQDLGHKVLLLNARKAAPPSGSN